MTKEQFDKTCQELRERGYRRNFRNDETLRGDGWNYYYKVIERRDDGFGEERAINQLLFKIFHLNEFKDRVPKESMYALEPVVMFSRNTSERIDLTLSYPMFSIDELEDIAIKFGEWADKNIEERDE